MNYHSIVLEEKPFMVTESQKHHDEEMKAAADQLVFTNLWFFGSLAQICHWLQIMPVQYINPDDDDDHNNWI